MRNKKIFIILLICIVSITSIITIIIRLPKSNTTKCKHNVLPTITLDKLLDEIINKMTIDEKIGQMLILNLNSDSYDLETDYIMNNVQPGGVILLGHNISTYDGTINYVNELKKNSKIPLIVSIDQEGGRVQRLKYLEDIEVSDIPPMYDLGITNDTRLAYDTGKVMAEELRTIGVNIVYAPVLDIFSNPNNTVIGDRSFGENKENVSKMALSLASGLEDNGVIATYKHFPGHGDTAIDSHYDLPLISKTKEELLSEEIIPFKNAVENGAKIVMIGHLALPNITNDNTPASLSKDLIDILKNDLNYSGLVITDALNMGALTNYYPEYVMYPMAINAGVDLLLMPNDYNIVINSIKENVSETKINEIVKKILTFKYTYLSNYNSLDKSYLNSKEHQEIIAKIRT